MLETSIQRHTQVANNSGQNNSSKFFKSSIQPKLNINQTHDVYKQEADTTNNKLIQRRDIALQLPNHKSFFAPKNIFKFANAKEEILKDDKEGIKNPLPGIQLKSEFGDGVIQTKLNQSNLNSSRLSGNKIFENIATKQAVIKLNDQGSEVKNIQELLIELGFYLPLFGVDGKFGKETKKAIENFQKQNNIVSDGIVGSNTIMEMDKVFSGTPPLREYFKIRSHKLEQSKLRINNIEHPSIDFY